MRTKPTALVAPDCVHLSPEPIVIVCAAHDLRRVVAATRFVPGRARASPPAGPARPRATKKGRKPERTCRPPIPAQAMGVAPHRTASPRAVVDLPVESHLVFRFLAPHDLRVYGFRPAGFGRPGMAAELRLPATVLRARNEPHVFTLPRWRLARFLAAKREGPIEISECDGIVDIDGALHFRSLTPDQWATWCKAFAHFLGRSPPPSCAWVPDLGSGPAVSVGASCS